MNTGFIKYISSMKVGFLFVSILFFAGLNAQDAYKVDMYIMEYSHIAIEEQIRTGIPAAIKLAQAIHESGAGCGDLAIRSNNHFGIKCKSNWTGKEVYHDDDEKGECFRAYDSVEASFRDHSDFLRRGKRYESLFNLSPFDYKEWAYGLKKAGYATNPKYPGLLINLIETYNLQVFTEIAAVKMAKKEAFAISGELN